MKNNVIRILKKELRETFRDKKSLSMMLIIPFMIPLLVIGMSALFEMQMDRPIEDYNKIGMAYDTSDAEKNIIEEVGIEAIYDTEDNLIEKYQNGDIDLYITKNNNKYIINGNDSDTTSYAVSLVEPYIMAYKEYLQSEYLNEKNIDSNEVMNIITYEENIIKSDNFFGNYITVYSFLFIIMAITISATYPATDTTAGEKERGTLETLLTFPIKSKDIIIGKYLSVSISSIITGVLSFILTIVSLVVANNMFEIYKDMNLMPSIVSIIFSIVVILSYSLLISGLCIAIASKSKTFKEAQSSLTPLTFVSFFPGMIAFMIDIETTTVLSLVPFLNFTLLFEDITNGNINYLNILLMLISTIVIIVAVLRLIIKQYKSEKVLFSN